MNYKVSIWLGNFPAKKELEEYVEETYNNDKNAPNTQLGQDYNIYVVDNDFTVVGWKNSVHVIDELIMMGSYWESFITQIQKKTQNIKVNEFNSIIFQYEFEYKNTIQSSTNTVFMGVFDYNKGDVPDYMKDIYKKMGWT